MTWIRSGTWVWFNSDRIERRMISGSSLYIGTSTTTRSESTGQSVRGAAGRRADSTSFTAKKSSPSAPIIDLLTMTRTVMPTRPQTSAGLMRRRSGIGSTGTMNAARRRERSRPGA